MVVSFVVVRVHWRLRRPASDGDCLTQAEARVMGGRFPPITRVFGAPVLGTAAASAGAAIGSTIEACVAATKPSENTVRVAVATC